MPVLMIFGGSTPTLLIWQRRNMASASWRGTPSPTLNFGQISQGYARYGKHLYRKWQIFDGFAWAHCCTNDFQISHTWSSFWTMQNFVNIAQRPAGIVLPWRWCIFISSYLIFSWTHIVTVFDSVTYNVLFHNPISNTVVCNSDIDYNDYLVVFKWCDVHGSHLLRLCPCHFAL